MNKTEEAFLRQSEMILRDAAWQDEKAMQQNTFHQSLAQNLTQFSDVNNMQQQATTVRWRTIEKLEKLLIEFEANIIKNSGKVLWARNPEEAQKEILSIIKRNGNAVNTALNGMFSELELDDAFAADKIYNEENAEVCLVQARFVIADPGAVVITSNDASVQNKISKAKVVIALAHIDDMLPSLTDLNLFLPLLASYSSEKSNFPFTKIIFSPKNENDEQGPEALYVLLVDNGRSELMSDVTMRELNRCIHCDACKHVCPVYHTTGMKPYDNEHLYTGPLSALEKSHTKNFAEFNSLIRNTTSCGACTEVCPVKIPLHKMFLHSRKRVVDENLQPQREQLFYYLWKKAMLKRDRFSFAKSMSKKLLVENVFQKVWGSKENMPVLAAKSFNELWREKNLS